MVFLKSTLFVVLWYLGNSSQCSDPLSSRFRDLIDMLALQNSASAVGLFKPAEH